MESKANDLLKLIKSQRFMRNFVYKKIDNALEKSTDERERRAIDEFIDWF